ncbi:MAG TPA: hypothetical protein VF307_04745 [Candidatus Nanopelagicaceae bacterium]
MAKIAKFGSYVILTLSPLERAIAMHKSPRAKYSEIISVKKVKKPWKHRVLRGIGAPGLGLSFLVSLGTWRLRKGKNFVAVYGRRPGYVITFHSGEFRQWIVTPKNSESDIKAMFEEFLSRSDQEG